MGEIYRIKVIFGLIKCLEVLLINFIKIIIEVLAVRNTDLTRRASSHFIASQVSTLFVNIVSNYVAMCSFISAPLN